MSEEKRLEIVRKMNRLINLVQSESRKIPLSKMNAIVKRLQEFDHYMFVLRHLLIENDIAAFCLYFREKEVNEQRLRKCFRESVDTAGATERREEASRLYTDICKKMDDLLPRRRSSM